MIKPVTLFFLATLSSSALAATTLIAEAEPEATSRTVPLATSRLRGAAASAAPASAAGIQLPPEEQRALQVETCWQDSPDGPVPVSCEPDGLACNAPVGCPGQSDASCIMDASTACQNATGFQVTPSQQPGCAWQYACCTSILAGDADV